MRASVSIDFTMARDPAFQYRYLHYFIMGLRQRRDVDVTVAPSSSRMMAHLFEARLRGSYRAWNAVYERGRGLGDEMGYVRWTFVTAAGRQIKVVIDFWDARTLTHPDALEWCDIYFKTNFWPTLGYPQKVLPLMNGNGLLRRRDLHTVRGLRNAPRSRDLVYWTGIWEPRSGHKYSAENATNIVEHQLRLFETLSELDCEADLIAIVPSDLGALSYADVARRLESRGVTVQPNWGDIDTERLWAGLAGADVVFLRPGNHQCISWRMTELLAMGACIVYDGAPFPNWQVPLVAGEHYLDGQCRLTPEFALPPQQSYVGLADRVANLLADTAAMRAFRHATGDYFDRHGTPRAVAEYLLQRVEVAASGSAPARGISAGP